MWDLLLHESVHLLVDGAIIGGVWAWLRWPRAKTTPARPTAPNQIAGTLTTFALFDSDGSTRLSTRSFCVTGAPPAKLERHHGARTDTYFPDGTVTERGELRYIKRA